MLNVPYSCILQQRKSRHDSYHRNTLAYALCDYVEDVSHEAF
jgi:hypothetical protein